MMAGGEGKGKFNIRQNDGRLESDEVSSISDKIDY
jgi:hypothetical protein